ncbi:MAG TPA: LysM peptidoglycan-binding domain-containing protein [Caldilineae bacterium]|nr:LysM peptidoglycan-binding domain-containing protein [Caldilineae bacterium]
MFAESTDQGGKVHVVRRGDTLAKIALRYGVSVTALARANKLRNANLIYVGQRLWIPTKNSAASSRNTQPAASAAPGSVHVVRRGDTLAKIAQRYGVSISALRQANNIRNINRIYVGQRLRIPGRAAQKQAASAPKVVSPKVASGKKWIEVDLSSQRLIAHQGDSVVLRTKVSTGLRYTPTPVGRYAVRTKVRRQTMTGPGYSLPNVQWVMYFYRDYAIHGTYWHNRFGRPMSHGCVNARNGDAKFLYNWADYGTPVIVHR